MTHTVAIEAEGRLADLLDQVEAGESITITRRGRPVAVLAPMRQPDRAAAIQELRNFGKGRRLNGIAIRELIDEGRRS